jgi:hypothetical protein
MAGRAKVIEAFKQREGHPCFVKGYTGTYKYELHPAFLLVISIINTLHT